jgi:hypothetical protein
MLENLSFIAMRSHNMTRRKYYSVLMILGMLSVFAFAAGNVSAQDASLTAYATSATITLDGEDSEAAWDDADSLVLSDVDGEGIDITLKALHDDTYVYIFAHWNDATENNRRKGWVFDGATWTNLGEDEDRMNFAWSIGGEEIVCGHNAGNSGGGSTMLFDIWHWKATRTAPDGWTDDKYWSGDGRHGDAKSAGGYSDNSVVKQAADGAAITSALGNSTDVSAFSDDDRPFWDSSGAEISWSAGVNATPLTDFISGYKTVRPTGSRGDVQAESVFEHGDWHVEYKRALDTGNADDDIIFAIGSTYTFYVSTHNNSTEGAHYIYPTASSPGALTLEFSALTGPATAPPLDTTLILVVAGGAVVIIVIAVIVLKKR